MQYARERINIKHLKERKANGMVSCLYGVTIRITKSRKKEAQSKGSFRKMK